MIDQDKRQEAILLYDRFTHEGMDRRDFMARMTAIAGSAAAAEMLIAGIAASPAAAAIVPADDKRLTTRTMTFSEGAAKGFKAYVAEPRTRSLKASVLVIHENRGLNDYARDVARRLAVAGFRGVAADFLSASGGTPANEDKAREMIGKLDLGAVTAAGAAMVRGLARTSRGGKVGAVGFCWGGAFINRLAIVAGKDLDAGVSYYGTAPNPAEATKVQTPLLIHLAGLDERVNRSAFPWVSALRVARKPVEYHGYAGVNHAFHNDTSAERYDKAAAELSWERTIRFFRRYLG
jgi:carboxymethylenebutenolidase